MSKKSSLLSWLREWLLNDLAAIVVSYDSPCEWIVADGRAPLGFLLSIQPEALYYQHKILGYHDQVLPANEAESKVPGYAAVLQLPDRMHRRVEQAAWTEPAEDPSRVEVAYARDQRLDVWHIGNLEWQLGAYAPGPVSPEVGRLGAMVGREHACVIHDTSGDWLVVKIPTREVVAQGSVGCRVKTAFLDPRTGFVAVCAPQWGYKSVWTILDTKEVPDRSAEPVPVTPTVERLAANYANLFGQRLGEFVAQQVMIRHAVLATEETEAKRSEKKRKRNKAKRRRRRT